MEQSSSGFQRALLALSPGHDFGTSNDLVATGVVFPRDEYNSVGNGCCATSNGAGVDGLAGLQALAK